jgi:hypothetical protein
MKWHGGNADRYAWIHWFAPFAIDAMQITEPPTIGRLAGAMLGLMTLGLLRAPPAHARR